ncbi:MAG: carboxypeptidase regulatory-like domain-containing protein [Blastocatellia bacterium]|nr:carboxypeptidase regulatory-like domain-containing protein [Blastocatellia bacterium]
MFSQTIKGFWGFLFVLCGCAIISHGQIDTASLSGQVADTQGAVINNARVVLTNQGTNISIEATTNAEGYYNFTGLRPSLYTVEVSQNGFATQSRKDYQLNVGQKVRLDFQLSVGTTTVSVEVTTENQVGLQRDDATLGNVVDNRRISTLPLPQRSWDDLIVQVAGTQGDPYTEQSGGTASGRTGSVNIHGVRSLQNNFILDGQDNQFDFDQCAGIFLPQSFASFDRFAGRIQSNYRAIFGGNRTLGGRRNFRNDQIRHESISRTCL